jgi:hypothetical protein
MRIDLYTKTILTLLVLLLAIIALKPMVTPGAVSAQSSFNGIQWHDFSFFDSRTRDVWIYDGNGKVQGHYKLTQLGQPLTIVKRVK